MLNSRKTILLALALLVAGAAATAQADQLTFSDLAPGQVGERRAPLPLGPQSITQSLDVDTVTSGTSAHCPVAGTQTHWWRLFDLDGDHGLDLEFCVQDIDYGIESLTADQTLTIRVHCLAHGLAFNSTNLVEVGMASVPHTSTSLTLHNAEVTGCCNAYTEDMAIQLSTQDAGFFVGCNSLGQTAPTYISASGASTCGVPEPIDLAAIGFVSAFLVLVVTGTDVEIDDGGVPATTEGGALLIVLALLGSSAWFLRRRATGS